MLISTSYRHHQRNGSPANMKHTSKSGFHFSFCNAGLLYCCCRCQREHFFEEHIKKLATKQMNMISGCSFAINNLCSRMQRALMSIEERDDQSSTGRKCLYALLMAYFIGSRDKCLRASSNLSFRHKLFKLISLSLVCL